MHAAPLKYKPGTMRRWIGENNKGVKIVGIRWLLREDRRGQEASSLVIYMGDPVGVRSLRMGRRLFRTTGTVDLVAGVSLARVLGLLPPRDKIDQAKEKLTQSEKKLAQSQSKREISARLVLVAWGMG